MPLVVGLEFGKVE